MIMLAPKPLHILCLGPCRNDEYNIIHSILEVKKRTLHRTVTYTNGTWNDISAF